MLQLTIRLGVGSVAIVQTIERPMANVAVIAMGVTAHQVIVTQVTNMVSGTPTIEK